MLNHELMREEIRSNRADSFARNEYNKRSTYARSVQSGSSFGKRIGRKTKRLVPKDHAESDGRILVPTDPSFGSKVF